MAKKQKSEVATRTLYRPVGLYEMEKILKVDARAFPPRLPEQPVFYPVLNYDYAEQIARDWNTKDANSGYAGFVTAFEVDAQYLKQFEIHTVGANRHQELWIPAERLDEFNQHIQGRIEIQAAFYGENFEGAKHWYQDWYADKLFISLCWASGMDFSGELINNRIAIQINFRYWLDQDYSDGLVFEDQKQRTLYWIAQDWHHKFPDIPLFGSELVDAPPANGTT